MASALAWRNKSKTGTINSTPPTRSFVIGLFYAPGAQASNLSLVHQIRCN